MPSSGKVCLQALFKVFEIVLHALAIFLILQYHTVPIKYTIGNFLGTEVDYSRMYVCISTTGGYLLISSFLLLGYLLDGIAKAPRQEILMMIGGAILSIVSGALLLEFYMNNRKEDNADYKPGLGYGALNIVNCIVYIIDAIIVFTNRI